MRPLAAVPVVGLLAGAALALPVADRAPALPVFAFVFVVAACSALTRAPGIFIPAVALSFAAGGALLSVQGWRHSWRSPLRLAFERARQDDGTLPATLTGTLRSDAIPREGAVTLDLDVQTIDIRGHASGMSEASAEEVGRAASAPSVQMSGGVLVTVRGTLAPGLAEQWRAGRTLRFPVRLRRPTRHLDPGVGDEERALARRGVSLVGSVKSGALVEVASRGPWWAEAAGTARAATRRRVAAHVGRWSVAAAGVVAAILIGDRAGLTPDLERALQDAGTYHVIAISGGNIAILAALTLGLFRWAGVLGRTAMVTAVGAFLAYGLLVQGGASVDRAIATAALFFLARALDLRVEPLHGVGVAAGVLVAADPLSVADPGFLLSFGATAAIVILAPLVRERGWPRALSALAGMLLASAAAELALLPIGAFYFGRVTLAGLVLNFVAIPAMALAQMAGLLLVPLSLLSPALASALGWVAAIAASALIGSASFVEWAPWMSWRVARPSLPVITAYYGAALCLWGLWFAGRSGAPVRWHALRVAALAAWSAAAIWVAFEPWAWMAARGDGRLHLTFIDVGQGDAAFVKLPRGATLLVDAGGLSPAYDVGDRIVAPVLREAGVRRLGSLVVTHGDVDHAGGAAAIVREFEPAQVWEGVPVPRLALLNDVRQAVRARRARWTSVRRDDEFVVDAVRVVVHHPAPADWERQEPRNDDSVVLELRWRDVSIVLTGDIGRETEQIIADRFEAAPLRAVKVPHHGSLTSSTEPFLRRLRPQIAVVSAGRGNPFGHPAPAVVRRYEAIGAAIFRTDEDGAVMLETDGYSASVKTYSGRSLSFPRRHESTNEQDDSRSPIAR
jgi:competence protein ComEC